jgi:hypothetical protein
MGLYVQSLANIPTNHHRDYFIYLLDYGWAEPLGEALVANYEKMASLAAENNAVVIRGTKRVHFEDEVLSWHNINGENSEDSLPAILITNRHPRDFKESFGPSKHTIEIDLKLILIPLKLFCKTTTDVVKLIERLFHDISAKRDLSDFRIAKEIKKGNYGAVADAIILGPSSRKSSIDYDLMISFLRLDDIIGKLKGKLQKIKPETRASIEDGLSEFMKGNYVSSVRILYPSIEEITNQMLLIKENLLWTEINLRAFLIN